MSHTTQRKPTIEVGPFDNEYSIHYKWADTLNIPTKYIVVRDINKTKFNEYITNGISYIPLPHLVDEIFKEKGDLSEQFMKEYEVLHQTDPEMSLDDILYMIYHVASEYEEDLELLRDELNKLYQRILPPIRSQVAPKDFDDILDGAPKGVPKPVAKPAPKGVPKPVAKPAPKGAPKPVAKPAPKEVSKSVAKPAPKPVPKGASKPVTKVIAKPVANTVTKSPGKLGIPVSTKFRNLDDLKTGYSDWIKEWDKLIEETQKTLKLIKEVQTKLRKTDPLLISPFTENGKTVRYHPKFKKDSPWTGKAINPLYGFDIFASAESTIYVPYIQYNRNSNQTKEDIYYKAYLLRSLNLQGYNTNLQMNSKYDKPHTIYFRCNMDIKSPHGVYNEAIYNLETNTLMVSGDAKFFKGDESIITYLKITLPFLDFGKPEETIIRGDFNVYGVSVDIYSFYDLIINDPIFSSYLFVHEQDNAYPNKKRISLAYKSLSSDVGEGKKITKIGYIKNKSSLRSNINEYKMETETKFPIRDKPKDKLKTFPTGTPYLTVKVSAALSKDVINRFMDVLSRLMRIYKEEQVILSPFYLGMIPQLEGMTFTPAEKKSNVPKVQPRAPADTIGGFVIPKIPVTRSCRSRPGAPPRKNGKDKIDALREIAPEIFVTGYPRICQCNSQPVILAPTEEILKNWKEGKKQKVVIEGEKMNRQIMKYPREEPGNNEPRYLIVCPESDNAYPGVKENKTLLNSDKYPYFPCCYPRDQINGSTVNLKYNIYFKGAQKEPATVSHSSHKKISAKTLDPGRQGAIPAGISELLRANADKEELRFDRYGVPRSINSLIHCVLTAIDENTYAEMDLEEQEEYVQELREKLAKSSDPKTPRKMYPTIFKQELYDYTLEEIEEFAADPEEFYDPQLFYRALEEYFNVNIYVFTGEKKKKEETFELELPRHLHFHSRPLRTTYINERGVEKDRKTILIYKHMGAASEKMEYPQCELIVNPVKLSRSDTIINKIFSSSMGTYLHQIMMKGMEITTWTFDEKEVTPYSNIYMQINQTGRFKQKPTYQILDNAGKMRGLVFGKSKQIMILFAPSQPENLPVIDEIVRADSKDIPTLIKNEIKGVTVKSQVAGDTATPKIKDLIDGHWYGGLDPITGFYVPVIPYSSDKKYPQGDLNPFFPEGTNVSERTYQLYRSLSFFQQYVTWLFAVAQLTSPTKNGTSISADQFVKDYFVVAKKANKDSVTFYDFSKGPRIFPDVTSVEDGIRRLSNTVPSMFQKSPEKIICYNANFLDKMTKYLREFSFQQSPHGRFDSWILPSEIDGYYRRGTDFPGLDENILIFVGEKDYRNWIESTTQESSRKIIIHTKMRPTDVQMSEPYFYLGSHGEIYLVQNTKDNSMDRALTIANSWAGKQINPGLNAEIQDGKYKYVIYGISANEEIIPIRDVSNGSKNPLQILSYDSEKTKHQYAALLRMV